MTAGPPVLNSTFTSSTSVLTVTGKPDLQITALTYAAGTSYVGGTVIPMSLTYSNNGSTNGTANVPYTPGINGFPAFVRIQVVLSSNPTFGDADDFQLTINDINASNFGSNLTTDNSAAPNAAMMADGSTHTFSWNQILPGNFSGSYYVLAKIDSLNALPQNTPAPLTVNGNPIWGGNTLNPSGTLINLLPSNFPTVFLSSHGTGVATSANGYSDNPSMTADGRYTAFASDATNLVAGDTFGQRDIFFFDSQTSLVHRVSLSQQGSQANGASNNPAISSLNGRYVAFESLANNLDTFHGDTNGFSDIYVVDTLTGLISRVSGLNAPVPPGSPPGSYGQANNPSFKPAISETGRYIVFESTATNLVPGITTAFGVSHVYLYDRDVLASGTFDTTGNTSTKIIDVDATTPLTAFGNADAIQPTISADASWVAFASKATNLVAPATTAGRQHVYVRPFANIGTATSGIKLISVQNGVFPEVEGGADSQTPSLSAKGEYVAFASLASNLVAGDTNGVSDIFVYDNSVTPTAGPPIVLPKVTRMSMSNGGFQGIDGSAPGFQLGSINPTISADGRYVAFASLDSNLTAGDVNGQYEYGNGAAATATIGAGAVTGFTVTSGGTLYNTTYPPKVRILGGGGTGASATATVVGGVVTLITVNSGGGGYVSTPTVSIESDSNNALDIFVHDRDVSASGTFDTGGNTATQMVSVNPFGYQTNGLSGVPSTAASNIYPVISANGRFVAFPSDAENNAGFAFGATNLLPLDSNALRDVFLFDRRTNASITPATPPTVTITSPGATPVLVNTAVTLQATATTNIGVVSSVQFFVNGTSLGTSTVFPYTQTWTPTAVGIYTLSALVTDSFGNIGVSSNVTVTVNAAPSVGITSPGPGSSIIVNTVHTVTATAAASNPGATIASVQFFANGISLGAPIAGPGALYSISWTPAATGSYVLTAIAIDSVGTQQTSPGVAVVVSPAGGGGGGATPPTVTLISSAPAASSSPVNVPVTLTASATASGGFTVTSVQFYVNGVSIASTLANPNPATTAPYTVKYTPIAAGTYTFTALATDSSANTGTTTPLVVNVTGAAPSVAFGLPVPATLPVNLPQILTANATAASGYTLTKVEYFANGVSLGSATAYPYLFTWTPAATGTYVITVVATDNIGSQSLAIATTTTVTSGLAPTIPFTSPIAGASYAVGNPITVAATAALGSGLVTGVQFFANGVSIGSANGLPFSVTFTPTASGTYVFTAIGTDTSGNTVASTPVSVSVVGATAPTVAISSLANNASLSVNVPQKVTVSASSSTASLASVDLSVNGVALGSKTAFPYVFDWTPASEGTYVLIAVATDSLGAKTTSIPISVKVAAAAPPTVSITAPATGSSYPVGNPIAVTASAIASATGLTISGVEFFANGVSLGTNTASPYTLTWTPTAAGNYSLSAIATDTSGARATSTAIAVTIGLNAPPTISLTSPSAGSTYALGTGVLLSASAADSDGTVTSVQFFANGLLLSTATAAPYTFSWVPHASGVYQITASAIDNSGNVTTTPQLAVTISAAASTTVAITNPVAGGSYPVGNALPYVVAVAGGNGPITQVQFFVNGLSIGTKTTSPYVEQWTPGAPGTYTLLAVATDSAGISTNSLARTTTITANAPPTVTLTNPASGTSVNAGMLVSLTAAAFDSDGTVVSVVFLANGNIVATATVAPFIGTWIPTAAGAYTVTAQATDNSGNVTNSTPITINVFPNQSPTVSLTSPVSGSTVRVGGSITLTSNAGDVDGTVASVQFFANGVLIGTDTTPPYTAQWAPTADGIYRLVAVAIDNSGAVTTSATVLAIASTGAGDNSVTAGSYQGLGEVGNYAVITAVGKTAVFIAYSTTPGIDKTYFYPGIPVDISGGFNLNDASGVTLISGNVNVTGTSATFDAGRLQFIGIDTIYLAGAVTVPARYYTGSLTGHAASALSAIVGSDGSIMLYVADGSFTDAGGGGLGGKINSTGAFNVTTVRGNRFTGKVDPVTGLLTGTLSGANGGAFTGAPAILGVSTSAKVSGAGRVVQADIVAPNGNIYDQVLLQGGAATITADPGKITRVSYVDLTNDIVQVEFSGAGALAITLDNPSGPATALNYNQPNVAYMKGHAGIVISGANESTNVSVFSVGRLTAFDPTGAFNVILPLGSANNPANNGSSLFQGHASTAYDGVADIAYLAILSIDGKFGGIRTANASYFATTGITGVLAPGVQFTGPVYVGDISAADAASPMLLLGSASDVRITGGNLFQTNGKAVQVSGLSQLKFVSGVTSQGATLPAQTDKSRLEEDGADVTAKVVVNPGP